MLEPHAETASGLAVRRGSSDMTMSNNKWIVRRVPRDKASLRLFCLPHAGAGSVIFRDWFADFPETIDVCAIEPPGRLVRYSEPSIADAQEFAAALEAAID